MLNSMWILTVTASCWSEIQRKCQHKQVGRSSPIPGAPVTISVFALSVQHQDDDRHDGLQQHKLQRPLLALAHKAAIHRQWREAACHVSTRWHQNISVHLHFHCTWPTNVGQAQGQEVVNHPGLVAAAQQPIRGKIVYHAVPQLGGGTLL